MNAMALQIACLAALVIAGPAAAQSGGRPANSPLVGDDLRPFAEAVGDSAPDTTAPWRYFPLAVGNVWEYEGDTYDQRYEVTGDTVALGRHYFVVEQRSAFNPRNVLFRHFLRFDTTSAMPHEYVRLNGQPDVDIPYAPQCPLIADFGETVTCSYGDSSRVSGGYDGALVFGEVRAGMGTDTVRTAVKAFEVGAGFTLIYGADVGLVNSYGEGSYESLRYYRIGEVEHGVPVFSVADEPRPTARDVPVRVWPNPTRGPLTLAVAGGPSGEAVVTDALGREVARVAVPPSSPAVPATTTLDLTALPPGVYIVRVGAGGVARVVVAR